MAKFLIKASFTADGVKGLLKEGGSSRKASLIQLLGGLGGKVEAFYFAFGEADAFVIADLPDAVTAAALSFAVNASGALKISTTPLLTLEEIDAACKKPVNFRPPGK